MTAVKFGVFLALLIGCCLAFEDISIFEDEDIISQGLPPEPLTGFTVPGTKWCGPGNTATDYDDLGLSRETDICCRAHDHCVEIMRSHTSLHNLENPDLFPRLRCSCEYKFLTCLKEANTTFSNSLGRLYFGARKFCFGQGHPILDCHTYQRGIIRKRCIRYNVDITQPKVWQFYELPFYSGNRTSTLGAAAPLDPLSSESK